MITQEFCFSIEIKKLLRRDLATFDYFGVFGNVVAASGVPIIALIILVLDWRILYNNFDMDPFYLTFAYFVPPSGEIYKKLYSSRLHVFVLSVPGFLFALEGFRTFAHNLTNIVIGVYSSTKCLSLVNQSIKYAPAHTTIASKLENGIKVYDTFCIYMGSGKAIQSYHTILILGLGYIILMFNAAAAVMAWDLLPIEIAWFPPIVTITSVILLLIVLPIAIKCNSSSEALLRRWMNLAKRNRNTRCVRKQLASRLPVAYTFGEFRNVNREFMRAYVESILERTSNQILVYQSGGALSV